MNVFKKITKSLNRSSYNGKIKLLKENVTYLHKKTYDQVTWKKGQKVKIIGVNYLYTKIQGMGNLKFQIIHIPHYYINW